MATPFGSTESESESVQSASEPAATFAHRLSELPTFCFGSGPPPPPGVWAEWIRMKFGIIWNDPEPKSATLQILHGRGVKQELVLRLAIAHMWTPGTLIERIDTEPRKFEAAAMQVVGTVREPAIECRDCPRNFGPFEHCIVVEGIPGCGKCHWNGTGEECTLNPRPVRHIARHPASQPVRQPTHHSARRPARQVSVSTSTSESAEGPVSTIDRMNEVIKAEKEELETLEAMIAEKLELIKELEDIKQSLTS